MNSDIARFEEHLDTEIRHAQLMAEADMIPEKFKGKPANILVAREIAQSMGESPWVTMSELYFVGNIPTFSAKYMRSRVRSAGHILREAFDEESMTATCVIIRRDDPEFEHVVTWDKQKAMNHGLWGKGHWKKNPQLMLKNRAVSECVREACNEVMGGVDYTAEEAEAMQPVKATASRRSGADGVRAALAKKKPTGKPAEQSPSLEQADQDADAELAALMIADADKADSRDTLKQIGAKAAEQLDGDTLASVNEVLNRRWEELA